MSSSSLPSQLRQQVIERAGGRCEYCLVHQDVAIYTHEVDHIIAIKHGGKTRADNLALACLSCNRHKGSDVATIDGKSCQLVPLFNPRRQAWDEHFRLNAARIEGKTQIGQATVRLLKFNDPKRILERQVLMSQGQYS